MSVTWHGDAPTPEPPQPGGAEWLLVALRAVPVFAVLGTGVALMALLRLAERPLCGLGRPVTPWITVVVCRAVLACLGLGWRIEGHREDAPLIVANHASWLDIFVLNAVRPVFFVAKAEVAGWPGIGLLARITGTVFIARDRRKAAEQADMLRQRLAAGHRLVLFPEGTSSDGRRVLPFRSTLFGSVGQAAVQPVTLAYTAPEGADPRFYGWWSDMDMAPHLLAVLAARPQGRVRLIHHAAIPSADRKALAAASEAAVRTGLENALGPLEGRDTSR